MTLFLSDNAFVIRRKRIRDDTGAVPAAGLAAHCFLSLDGETVLGGLEKLAQPLTGDTLRAEPFGGAALTTALEPLLEAAEAADEELRIYSVVHITGMHRDLEDVVVERTRLAGER